MSYFSRMAILVSVCAIAVLLFSSCGSENGSEDFEAGGKEEEEAIIIETESAETGAPSPLVSASGEKQGMYQESSREPGAGTDSVVSPETPGSGMDSVVSPETPGTGMEGTNSSKVPGSDTNTAYSPEVKGSDTKASESADSPEHTDSTEQADSPEQADPTEHADSPEHEDSLDSSGSVTKDGTGEEGKVINPDDSEKTGFFEGSITDEIKQRINGLSYKADCTVPYEDLSYLKVLYVDFNGETRTGEIICNKAISGDLLEIFKELYDQRYEIDKIRLVDEYGADDDLSCADDNTSCFNFRTVEGSSNLSKHALGLAIDINPFYNPYVTYPNGVERISPPGSESYADRTRDFPHKIDKNDAAYKAFTAHGFKWGGDWKTLKDYQHFQKS